ncbi:hypothetical protein [Arsukibacterium sp.]|uniref:hypothetical protein n=1 Tax=Arsukibacterium sp. TaxID=1977258 RepID=UPI00299E8452|nr:hypothetical protein [Arsukibacterium sp.]MDX1539204.1 hypothetical protein [Arsukibacterium sp.]
MGIRTALLAAVCLLMPCYGVADSGTATEPEPSQTINLSYVSHPVIDTVLLPVIRTAYQNLGLKVNFIVVEAERGLRLLQDGMVDGDVARTGIVLAKLDNIITLTKLDELTLELHCRPGIQCKLADLTNPGVLIFFPESARTVKELQLMITAQKYHVSSWTKLVELYQADKIDRFLWIRSSLTCKSPVAETTIVTIPTAPIEIFHVIHKSKSDLQQLLTTEIETELARVSAGRCH